MSFKKKCAFFCVLLLVFSAHVVYAIVKVLPNNSAEQQNTFTCHGMFLFIEGVVISAVIFSLCQKNWNPIVRLSHISIADLFSFQQPSTELRANFKEKQREMRQKSQPTIMLEEKTRENITLKSEIHKLNEAHKRKDQLISSLQNQLKTKNEELERDKKLRKALSENLANATKEADSYKRKLEMADKIVQEQHKLIKPHRMEAKGATTGSPAKQAKSAEPQSKKAPLNRASSMNVIDLGSHHQCNAAAQLLLTPMFEKLEQLGNTVNAIFKDAKLGSTTHNFASLPLGTGPNVLFPARNIHDEEDGDLSTQIKNSANKVVELLMSPSTMPQTLDLGFDWQDSNNSSGKASPASYSSTSSSAEMNHSEATYGSMWSTVVKNAAPKSPTHAKKVGEEARLSSSTTATEESNNNNTPLAAIGSSPITANVNECGSEREQHRKTQICHFWLSYSKGESPHPCRNGSACDFAHGEKELRLKKRDPLFYKTELCDFFMNEEKCKYGEACIYAHGHHDLRIIDEKTRKEQRAALKQPLCVKNRMRKPWGIQTFQPSVSFKKGAVEKKITVVGDRRQQEAKGE